MQVKAIDKEKFGKKATVSVYAIYVFSVSMNIDEENFSKWLMIHQIRQFFPTKIFPCMVQNFEGTKFAIAK